MRKKFVIGLTLIFLFSILANVFQYKKINDLKQDQKFYDNTFKSSFKELTGNFDFYKGMGTLSNECVIKNIASRVAELKALREFTSYKENKSLSLMLLYLSEFFVLKSNEFINANINDLKTYLIDINGLDDTQKIDNLNNYLWKKVSK